MVTTYDSSLYAQDPYTIDYHYKYPENLDLKPGSQSHSFIKDMILKRARLAYTRIQRRHASWREMDKTCNGFIWADEAEQKVKRSDPRKPISIVVPMTYATLQTKKTYFSGAFLTNPYLRYSPLGLTSRLKANLFERCVDAQMQRSNAGLSLLTQYRDNSLYGLGACAVFWEQEWGKKLASITEGAPRSVVDGMTWEGNRLVNLNPYFLLLDPKVGIQDVQKGEFFGWVSVDNYLNKLAKEHSGTGDMFNVRYLAHMNQRSSSIYTNDPSMRDRDYVSSQGISLDPEARPVTDIYMYIKLIPNEWGLGPYKYPQTWLVCLSADEIITQFHPVTFTHNMFPATVMASGYSGYDIAPVASLEVNFGLQEVMNFLLNSHVANTRKAVNDMIVFDPSVVSQADLQNPKPGKFIRARRSNFGTDLRQSIFQLPIQDITRNNINDIMAIWGFNERTSNVTSSMQGQQRNTSDRVTAAEINTDSTASMDHMIAEFRVVGMQAITPLARIVGEQTRQFMTQDAWVSVAGRDEALMRAAYPDQESISVTPADIDLDYDVVPHDMRNLQQMSPQMALQLFQLVSQNPILSQREDIGRLFNDVCARLGDPEMALYALPQAQVMPDQQVVGQAQAGNLVPISSLPPAPVGAP